MGGVSTRAGRLPGVMLVCPRAFPDNRGFFTETYHVDRYREAGIPKPFVQDNFSFSRRGVLRGLHYQLRQPQGKLIYVVQGEVFDVAVDIRRGSATFGQWEGHVLSGENHHQLYVPEGFAHGFVVLSDSASVIYKCTRVYAPDDEVGIAWNDPGIGIQWPLEPPLVSDRDAALPRLDQLPPEKLPVLQA